MIHVAEQPNGLCCNSIKFLFVCFPCSPEVQSILNLTPPQDAELMNANPSPPVRVSDHPSFCFCLYVLSLTHFPPFCVLFSAQSIPADQPRPVVQSLSQTQRLPLPQSDRQGQLRQGAPCTPPHRRPVLRRQSVTEKGHSQEKGGTEDKSARGTEQITP